MKATAVLKAWDRHTDTSSRGAVLYAQWFNHLDRNSVIKNPWKLSEPATTPNGIRNPAYAVSRLKQAAHEMMPLYGRLDVPWGQAYRFRSGKIDLPANGGWSYMGSYRAISYYFDKDRKFVAEGGDSYVAVTEFGKHPKAMVSLSYGNSTQPGSKHIGDQLKLMSEKKLRPALLNKTAILKNLEEKEELRYK
jgi:acyl-homoserine-lactone acylase